MYESEFYRAQNEQKIQIQWINKVFFVFSCRHCTVIKIFSVYNLRGGSSKPNNVWITQFNHVARPLRSKVKWHSCGQSARKKNRSSVLKWEHMLVVDQQQISKLNRGAQQLCLVTHFHKQKENISPKKLI